MTTTSDDDVREMLAARAARADRVQVGPILDRALRAPAASGGAPWWRSMVALGGAAVAAVALVVTAVWFAGGSRPGPVASGPAAVGASPTAPQSASNTPTEAPSASASPATHPSPSEAAPSPSPSATGPLVCTAADLTARILDWQGAAGSRIADIELASRGGTSCVVIGRPEVQLRDAHGAVLIDSGKSGSGPALVAPISRWYRVSPGHPVKTQVATSNYCGHAPALPVTVAFALAGAAGGLLVAAPLTQGVDKAEAVPPCNGQGSPATITTNGWTR